MKRKEIILPLIVTGVLVLSSFIPVLQITILSLNGGVIYLFEMIFGNSESLLYIINAVFAFVFIVAYYYSSKRFIQLLTTLCFVFFSLPLLMYSTENIFSENNPYYLQFLVIGLITGLILLFIAYWKHYKTQIKRQA
ncbi:MAG: hypothetical protein COW44_00615 [Flavobacteriaceae bacterium CG17_big_fil_post_rev_8_21_14_2_50_33_15]|nr:MAG: hypothetical protein COW44_00615 [Flavobacteriaceae bacterium CG17_big_fil_post_rev_8_21_14_2_50_33_15]